jgi:hypothetical protein
MIETISKKLAPTGILRVGINMSNFLLINGKDQMVYLMVCHQILEKSLQKN